MSQEKKLWTPSDHPPKKRLTGIDALHFGLEAGLVLLGISFLPSPQSGIALSAFLVELHRRAIK